MAKKEKELAAAKDEKLMDEKFELDSDALNKVAGGDWIGLEDGDSCLEHDWMRYVALSSKMEGDN